MLKFVMGTAMLATAMAGFSSAAVAQGIPDRLVGTWLENGGGLQWKIYPNGSVKELTAPSLDQGAGVVGYNDTQVTIYFRHNGFEGHINWNTDTGIGYRRFTLVPQGSASMVGRDYSLKMRKIP